MKLSLKQIFCLILCGVMLLFALGLTVYEFTRPAAPEETPLGSEEENPPVRIEIAAVGDNLMHMPLIKSGLTDTGYNFDGFYKNIGKYLDGIDIKAINQETVFINDPSRYSGYPEFGGPSAVGDAVVKAGFNVIEQASNHSYDKGTDGLSDTYAYWKSQNVTLLGINSDENDARRVDTFTKDGFTVAMMNYTYGLNGYVLPAGKEYLVNLLSDENRPAIAEQLARAKAESDILIMFVHWGTEYDTEPDDYQSDWLKFFNENGVDIIIGAHPHVLQPCEEYVGENGKTTLVYYSLGNFISNQSSIDNELGAMARITLVKDGDGARIESYSMEPCFTHVSGGKYTVYMLSDYTDDLARAHSKFGGSLTVERIRKRFSEITGLNILTNSENQAIIE